MLILCRAVSTLLITVEIYCRTVEPILRIPGLAGMQGTIPIAVGRVRTVARKCIVSRDLLDTFERPDTDLGRLCAHTV